MLPQKNRLFIAVAFILMLTSCRVPVYLRVFSIKDNPDSAVLLKRYLIRYSITKKTFYRIENNRLVGIAVKGDVKTAADGFNKLLEKEQNMAVLYYNLALLLSWQGQNDIAEAEMLKALKLEPGNRLYQKLYLRIFPDQKV